MEQMFLTLFILTMIMHPCVLQLKAILQARCFYCLYMAGPVKVLIFIKTDYITQNIGNKYAIVYWDQRNAGASQGDSNGNDLNLPQMTDDLKKVIQLLKGRYGQNSEVFPFRA